MFQTKVVQKVKTHISCSTFFFGGVGAFMRCGKLWHSQTGHRGQCNTIQKRSDFCA